MVMMIMMTVNATISTSMRRIHSTRELDKLNTCM